MAPRPKCDCGTCRRCKHRDYMRRWYQRMTAEERRAWVAKRDATKVRAADSARYYRDWDKRRALSKKWATENPERARELTRQWAKRNPEKRAAQVKVGNAIRDGRLQREPCEVCGATKVDAHHADYSKPLEVRWLCRAHHMELHRKVAA